MKKLNLRNELLLFLLQIIFPLVLFSQQSNDHCSNPTSLIIALDKDVWYIFETGDMVPENGIFIEAMFNPMVTTSDVPTIGIAVYTNSCEETNIPIVCFSNGDGTENSILVPPQCLENNSSFLVRVWSGGDPFQNAGTFKICAYQNTIPLTENVVILWKEDFDDGFGDWTTVGISESHHVWVWDDQGSFPTAFGNLTTLSSVTSSCNGAVGFPSGSYLTINAPGPPYPTIESQLISPTLDLSGIDCIATLEYEEAFRGLNGSAISDFGPLIDFSFSAIS